MTNDKVERIFVDNIERLTKHLRGDWRVQRFTHTHNSKAYATFTCGPFNKMPIEQTRHVPRDHVALAYKKDGKYEIFNQWNYVKKYREGK